MKIFDNCHAQALIRQISCQINGNSNSELNSLPMNDSSRSLPIIMLRAFYDSYSTILFVFFDMR